MGIQSQITQISLPYPGVTVDIVILAELHQCPYNMVRDMFRGHTYTDYPLHATAAAGKLSQFSQVQRPNYGP